MKHTLNLLRLSIVLLAALFFVLPGKAQVTIGSTDEPQSFSLLEITTDITPGGLRLPHLTTTQRNSLFTARPPKAGGLAIYNTTTKCVEYWNDTKWVSLCLGTANITLTGDPCNYDPGYFFPADGIVDPPCIFTPSDDPPCSEGYQVFLVVGTNYATLQIEDEQTSSFSIFFNPNNSSLVRIAVVRVINKCTGEFKEFVFTQNGATCPTGIPAFTLSSTPTTLCGTNGAVIAWVNNPRSGVNYVWEYGGSVVHTGNYMQITRAGKYTVYAGLHGCTSPPPQEITVTQSGGSSSNAPLVHASNGGILCANGNVVLTATNVTYPVRWFHNGVLYGSSNNPLSVNGASAAGEWFATQQNGACGSRMSNIVTLIDETGVGTALPPPVARVNGTLLSDNFVICKSGSLELSVTNTYPAGTVFEWFNGSLSIYRGTNPVTMYAVAPSVASMTLSVQVSDNIGSCPNTSVSSTVSVNFTAPSPTIINNGAGTAAICGSSPAVLSALNAFGAGYQWFRDGVRISGATAATYHATAPGSYTVRYSDTQGCWSLLSLPITVVQSAPISLSWQAEPPGKVTVGTTGSYTVLSSPAASGYSWTSSNPTVAAVTPIPPGDVVSVNYLTLGTTILSVEATNVCGTASLQKEIEVESGCAPVTNVSLNPSGTIHLSLNVDGTVKPGQGSTAFTATPSPSGSPDTYIWYVNGSAVQTGASNQYVFNTPPNVVTTYNIYVVASNSCSSRQSGTVTIIVTKDAVPDVSGNYRLSGKVCYDVRRGNDGIGDCMPLSSRTDDFAATRSFVYTFNSTNNSSYSLLSFEVNDPHNLVVSQSQSGNLLTVTFRNDINAVAANTTKVTALKLTVTAKYRDNLNQDKQVSLAVSVQDCSCGCTVAKLFGGYLTFMCYNLGADPVIQTLTPDQQAAWSAHYQVQSGLFQWGRKANITYAGTIQGPSGVDDPPHLDFILSSGTEGGKINFDWRWPQNPFLWGVPKTAYDPCPDGWRVPTMFEWGSIFRGLTTQGPSETATANKWTWNTTGTKGYKVTPPGASAPTLFLPITGWRYGTGVLMQVSGQGMYWTVNTTTTESYRMTISVDLVSPAYAERRAFGAAIRCVAE